MEIDLLPQYKAGSNLTLINVFYQRSTKDDMTGKWIKDAIVIIYKDNDTGKRGYEIITEPQYTFFKADDKIVIDHNLLFIDSKYVSLSR